MVFDAPLVVTAVATAGFPTAALSSIIGMGMRVNNWRLSDVNILISEFRADTNHRFDEVDRKILYTRELLSSEMYRMEQVFDTRLKHLEEAR